MSLSLLVGISAGVITPQVCSAETHLHGIVDVRASSVNSSNSYLEGGQGKFTNKHGRHLSLAQAGAELSVLADTGLSIHIVANSYASDFRHSIGITEAYVKYKNLPNSAGYRFENRTGIFYPKISLENNAYAWASKNTLNSSTLNTWIGEEIRVLGSEFSITGLGQLQQHSYDWSITATIFINNDPSGALLAWHGWTQGAKQTLWTEKPKIAWFPARQPGHDLQYQAPNSDPFLELDHRPGAHITAEWKVHGIGAVSLGYYDNRAKPYIVIKGQYGWHTQFFHAGVEWVLAPTWQLIAQYLSGSTLMQNSSRQDVVNNNFNNGFVLLSKKWQKHTVTARLEHFSMTDNDQIQGDNNNESGRGLTLNYSYRLNKPMFISVEYNWISSDRPAHAYAGLANQLTEQQWQVALRYFF